ERLHRIYGLFVLCTLIGKTFQQETTAAAAAVTTDLSVTTDPAPETSKPESAPAASSGSQCKPNEMLTEKGCVDREYFLNWVIKRVWRDSSLENKNNDAGLNDGCAKGHVMTSFGCVELPKDYNTAKRVPVQHSNFVGKHVVHSYYGAQAEDHNSHPSGSEAKKSRGRSGGKSEGPRVLGHNRPRKYVYLPGRLLRSRRQCRPYEVLGMDGRCIRRKAKRTGTYEHKNHYYGLQRRKRKEANP
ncbi:hypothetical protein KR018_006597, partial [Drosophila ironensis]